MKEDSQQRWDTLFFDICKGLGNHTRCLSRKVGAILVMDYTILSLGYNGPPRGIPHCNWDRNIRIKTMLENKGLNPEDFPKTMCPRRIMGYKSGEGLSLCNAAHGERNAIVNAAREGIKIKGTVLYLNTTLPCVECLKEIINAGIVEIVCTGIEYYDEQSRYMYKESGIKVRTFNLEES